MKFIITVLLAILFVLETEFFAYANWNPTVGGQLRHVILLFLFLLVIFKRPKIRRWTSGFGHVVKMLCIVSFLNVLPCYMYWGVPFSQGINIYVPLAFLTFYIYHAYNFTERDILRMFIGIAVVVVIIQIVQQLSPSNAVFGIYSDNETDWGKGNIVEVRNGLNRYRIGTTSLTLLCLFYYWTKIMQKRSKGTLLMFVLMLVSVYLYLTRQVLFFSALTLVLSFFMINDTQKKLLYLGLISLVSILLYNFSSVLFGELLESTVEESSRDNIRLIATSFFWNQSTSSVVQFLLGNGHPEELRYWGEMFGIWSSDVGFFGELFIYGACWVLLYFYQVWLVLVKYKDKVPLYLKLFILATLLDSVMIFVYAYEFGMVLWAAVLYLISINIQKNGCKCYHRQL